jgi:hypothetical protein
VNASRLQRAHAVCAARYDHTYRIMENGLCIEDKTTTARTASTFESNDFQMRREVKRRMCMQDYTSEEEEIDEDEGNGKNIKGKRWFENSINSTCSRKVTTSSVLKTSKKSSRTTSSGSSQINKYRKEEKTTIHKSVRVEQVTTTSTVLSTTCEEKYPGKTYNVQVGQGPECDEEEMKAMNTSRSSTPGVSSRSSTPGFSIVNGMVNRKSKSPTIPDCDNTEMLSPPLVTHIREFAFHDQENTFPYHFGVHSSKGWISTDNIPDGDDIGTRSVMCNSQETGTTLNDFISNVVASPNTILLVYKSEVYVTRRISEEYVQHSGGVCVHITPDLQYVAKSPTISFSLLKGVLIVDCSVPLPDIDFDFPGSKLSLRQTYHRRLHPSENESNKFTCIVSTSTFSDTELRPCLCNSEGKQIPFAFKSNCVAKNWVSFKDVVFNYGSVPEKRVTEEAQLRFELVHLETCIAFVCFPIMMFNSFHQLKRNVVRNSVSDTRVNDTKNSLAVADLETILDMEESEFPLFFNDFQKTKKRKHWDKKHAQPQRGVCGEGVAQPQRGVCEEGVGWTLPPLKSTFNGHSFE